MSIYAVLTPTTACRALHEAGFPHPAEALHIDAREERWAVSLPDGHIAWFPASEAGATRLAVERRVLGLLATRCSFRVPEILFVSNSGFDVRRMVPGRCDPWGLYRRCQDDPRLAQKIGHAIGQIFVEQHTRIVEADAVGWLRQQVPWPETGAWIGERLPRVIDDRGLIRALADVIEEYEGVAVDPADRALVHGDLEAFTTWRSIRPMQSTASSTTTALPGRIGITIFAICCSMSSARTCSTPRSASTNRPSRAASTEIASGSTTPPAQSAFWHSGPASRPSRSRVDERWLRICTGRAWRWQSWPAR